MAATVRRISCKSRRHPDSKRHHHRLLYSCAKVRQYGRGLERGSERFSALCGTRQTTAKQIRYRFQGAVLSVHTPSSRRGRHRVNDYDSIEVGNGSNNGLTPVERQTQISLWALGSAPFILGVDLTNLDQLDLQNYLGNTAVLAVDQDSIAAKRIVNTGNQEVFAKMETNGDAIVGLFNTGGVAEKVSVQASAVGLPENERGYSTRNLWTGEMKKTGGTITAIVPSHGVVLYRVKVL